MYLFVVKFRGLFEMYVENPTQKMPGGKYDTIYSCKEFLVSLEKLVVGINIPIVNISDRSRALQSYVMIQGKKIL